MNRSSTSGSPPKRAGISAAEGGARIGIIGGRPPSAIRGSGTRIRSARHWPRKGYSGGQNSSTAQVKDTITGPSARANGFSMSTSKTRTTLSIVV